MNGGCGSHVEICSRIWTVNISQNGFAKFTLTLFCSELSITLLIPALWA